VRKPAAFGVPSNESGRRNDPSPVLQMSVDLEGVPGGYAAMDSRQKIKVMVKQ
jgi:threonine dehydrogenase-like Zn-dependent dehydrogenase